MTKAKKKSQSHARLTETEKTLGPLEMARELLYLGEEIQKAGQLYASPEKFIEANYLSLADPYHVADAFVTAGKKIAEDPEPLFRANERYTQGYLQMCRRLMWQAIGHKEESIIDVSPGDRRFQDPAWEKYSIFSFLKHGYLLWDRWIKDVSTNVKGLEPHTAHKVAFYARQFSDAFAPGNYLWSNPEAMKKMFETGGQSLVKGLENFLSDLENGQGTLNISMVEREAFQVGKNIAMTPGKVIFQNDLIQLIQYSPKTEKVFKVPLLLIPPCINKFYIFDLRQDNSFVQFVLDQGHTVFMISWVNPDEKLSSKTFDDYIMEGVGEAIKVIQKITKEPKVNAVGYCIGGDFLAPLAAYYTTMEKHHNPLLTTTYLATIFDFDKAGDLKVFIDEEQLQALERQMAEKGYFDGHVLARTFNLLRANDLIWSFVINNYLMGEDPMAFDLLYWNSDSTNLPAAMYGYYLRSLFLKNKLVKPGGISVWGVKIDLRKIKIPTFIFATKQDHIAPWPSVFAGEKIFSGPTKFILGDSGHIAGIFNPPKAHKYSYWTGGGSAKTPEEWFAKATQHAGSWWTEWSNWIESHSKDKVPARNPGSKDYPPLEDAPGSYVLRNVDAIQNNKLPRRTGAK